MISVPGDSTSAPTSIDMLNSSSASEKFRRSSSPNYTNFSSSSTITNTKLAVTVGICAMEKKSLSKPMKEILTRIEEFEYIRTIIFSEPTILNVSFFSFIFINKYGKVDYSLYYNGNLITNVISLILGTS